MKISVIIPAFNEEKLICSTISSVRAAMAGFDAFGWDSELVICDNNSTDGTAELCRQLGVRVVFEPVNQIARARNTGAAAANGDWFIFVDADSLPSLELFLDCCSAIAKGNIVYGGSVIRFDNAPLAARCTVRLWNCVSRIGKLAAGSFIFCEANAFREIGGFNQNLFAGEEIELCRRLKTLARSWGKTAVILRNHPLVTSSRKIHLYSASEHLRFMIRTAFGWKRMLASREECHIWYDGRR